MEEKKEGNKVKLTGLWDNVTTKGETYMKGSLGVAKLLIFKNSFKEKETDPDWNLFLAPKEKKPDEQPEQPEQQPPPPLPPQADDGPF